MLSSHQPQLDHRYVMERVEIAITLSCILGMNCHFLYFGKCVSLSLGCLLDRVGNCKENEPREKKPSNNFSSINYFPTLPQD